MIAICVPSRGLLFSRTAQCVIEGMLALQKQGFQVSYFTTHDLPIPTGHNDCVERALSIPEVDRIVFIEEDMYIYPDAFVALATSAHPMATFQYNDKNGRPHGIIEFDENGEVVWCGLGATKIDRSVFDAVGKPYFETKRRWSNHRRYDGKKLIKWYEPVSTLAKDNNQYGGLDVDFCMRVREKKIPIICIKEHKAHHFQLIELGKPYVNDACHIIRQV